MLLTDPWDGRRYDQRARHAGEDPEHFFVGPAAFDVNTSIPEFFAGVDASERRKDSTLGKEYEVALPVELGRGEVREVARQFVERFVAEQRVVSVAIHWKENNPHAHVWVSDREWSPAGWGEKVKKWDQPKHLEAVRAHFAEVQNCAYERAGLECRVDHRSYKDRGLDCVPQRHEGRAPRDEVLAHNHEVAASRVAELEREREEADRTMCEASDEIERAHRTQHLVEKAERERIADERESHARMAAIEAAAAAPVPSKSDRPEQAKDSAALHPADRAAEAQRRQPDPFSMRGEFAHPADRAQAAHDAARQPHYERAARQGFGKRRAPESISAEPSPQPNYGPDHGPGF